MELNINMNIKVILLILLFVILRAGSVIALIKLVFAKNNEPTYEEKIRATAQDFTNVKDIRDCFLFTNDNIAFVYLEVAPISLEMMSINEQKIFTKNITAALSSERKSFKMISFPKPVDLSYLIYKYESLYKIADTDIEKRLINEEIKKMKQITLDNSASEFKFYFVFWDDENNTAELLKRARDFKNNFESSQIRIELISEKEIYRLCNMMHNPTYSNFDGEMDYNRTFPVLN